MTGRRIYTATIPPGSFGDQSGDRDATQQLAKLAKLSGNGSVARTGGQPDELTIQGQFRGRYADRAGLELQELFGTSDIGAVPAYAVGGTDGADGYYKTETGSTGRVQPQTGATSRFRARLVREGTRNTHWLAVDTGPTQDVNHPFGTDTTSLVGIPAAARRVRAVDSTTDPTVRERNLTPTSTVTAELGDIDLYDTSALSFSDPIYLYDLPYSAQGNVDAAVFDTYGEASQTNADGAFIWAQVFATSHEFAGELVLDNGLIRLTIDEPTNADATARLEAERWERAGTYGLDYGSNYGAKTATNAWVTQDLPASDWEPADVDLTHIGTASVRAQVEFENASTGEIYALNLVLSRGYQDVQFWPSDDATPVPNGLVELLGPIAHASTIDTQQAATLVDRDDVRQ